MTLKEHIHWSAERNDITPKAKSEHLCTQTQQLHMHVQSGSDAKRNKWRITTNSYDCAGGFFFFFRALTSLGRAIWKKKYAWAL